MPGIRGRIQWFERRNARSVRRDPPHHTAGFDSLNERGPRRGNRHVGVGDSALLSASQGLSGKILHAVGKDPADTPFCGRARILKGIDGPSIYFEARTEHLVHLDLG